MRMLALVVKRCVPVKMFRRDLHGLGKVILMCQQRQAPAFRIVIAKPRGILAAQRMVNIVGEYMALSDEVNDVKLLALASERMVKADPAMFVPAEHLYAELGITQDDLDAVDEVDIE